MAAVESPVRPTAGAKLAQCREDLIAEVRLLHRQFFGTSIPPDVERRYVAANVEVFPRMTPSHLAALARLVQHDCDAEAVECALRLRRMAHPLTVKVQILFYLVEVRSAYYGRFVDENPGPWKARCALMAAVMRTVWKFGKGNYQIARYRLA